MAQECARSGALLIHYSTDYVYDGSKSGPYDESDATGPLSVYGHTKLEGDQAIMASGCAHIILRTTWVYDTRGKNFLRTVLRLAREKEERQIGVVKPRSFDCVARRSEMRSAREDRATALRMTL